MMSRHARTHHPQPTPPPSQPPKKPEASRGDTTQRPAGKLADARSQANPTSQAVPARRLSSDQEFQLIQMRAYCLWEQAGRPDGDAARDCFWLQAEREVTAPRPVV
jgi:hypothetical protein